MAEVTAQDVLDCPMRDNDAGADTVRTYLVALLSEVWRHRECFGGKRPFGNSGWQYELYTALAQRGYITGEFDEDGYLDDVDSDAGDRLIADAIQYLAQPEVAPDAEAIIAAYVKPSQHIAESVKRLAEDGQAVSARKLLHDNSRMTWEEATAYVDRLVSGDAR